jgi:hypothetical protein
MTDFRAKGTIMGPTGLTAVFGMGTGVTPPVWSPEIRPAGGQAGPGGAIAVFGSVTPDPAGSLQGGPGASGCQKASDCGSGQAPTRLQRSVDAPRRSLARVFVTAFRSDRIPIRETLVTADGRRLA